MLLLVTNDNLANALRSRGLRVTSPRMATLAVLKNNRHAEAEAIAAKVTDRIGSVSRQAVYDALNSLTEVGLVRRVTPNNRAARYELEEHDNHHHLLCRSCGALVDVPCATGHVPCLTPDHVDDLTIEVAEGFYHGLCASCTAAQLTDPQQEPVTRRNNDI